MNSSNGFYAILDDEIKKLKSFIFGTAATEDLFLVPFRLLVREGTMEDFPARRDFAYTTTEAPDHPQDRVENGIENGIEIVFSPQLPNQTNDRIRAIIRHELAHALLLSLDNWDHTEQTADDLAEKIFLAKIHYDTEDVQTLDTAGEYPRPFHLPE